MTVIVPTPVGMPVAAGHCAGQAMFMATWWATEAIPIPATSLLLLALGPMPSIGEFQALAHGYADDIIFLFLSGFFFWFGEATPEPASPDCPDHIARGRLAPSREIAGFMLAIGMSVVSLMAEDDPPVGERYATRRLLAIAYAASIGGVATLIGTPPDALLAGHLSADRNIDVGFAQWMVVEIPVSVAMMFLAWLWLIRGGIDIETGRAGRDMLRDELKALGPVSSAEKRVGAMFLLAATLWITRPLLSDAGIDWLSDSMTAMCIGTALFVIPASDGKRSRVTNWGNEAGMPWGVLL